MNPYEFVIVLVSIILGCITLWIMAFAKGRRKKHHTADAETRYNLAQLSSMAESMQERIDILESILDAEIPDWREQHEKPVERSSH